MCSESGSNHFKSILALSGSTRCLTKTQAVTCAAIVVSVSRQGCARIVLIQDVATWRAIKSYSVSYDCGVALALSSDSWMNNTFPVPLKCSGMAHATIGTPPPTMSSCGEKERKPHMVEFFFRSFRLVQRRFSLLSRMACVPAHHIFRSRNSSCCLVLGLVHFAVSVHWIYCCRLHKSRKVMI